jgi:hypothetical protein
LAWLQNPIKAQDLGLIETLRIKPNAAEKISAWITAPESFQHLLYTLHYFWKKLSELGSLVFQF